MEACKWCDGKGRVKIECYVPDYDEECAACHGKGEVEHQLALHEIDYR